MISIWVKILMVFSLGIFMLAFMIWKWRVKENEHKASLYTKSLGYGQEWNKP